VGSSQARRSTQSHRDPSRMTRSPAASV
jgi:hypothetical protein